MASFNKRLLELRKQRELTQNELAESIGVNKQTISQYERGVRRPDFDTLCALCDFFNVSSDYLLGKADVTLRYVDTAELAKLNTTSTTSTLSPDEAELLLNYQKLNDLGKDRAREDVADLTEIPKYVNDYPDTVAAHFDGEEMTDQQKAAIAKLRDIVKQQEK